MLKPVGAEFPKFLGMLVEAGHHVFRTEKRMPKGSEIAKRFGVDATKEDDKAAAIYEALHGFFAATPPTEIAPMLFEALRVRWGFSDGTTKRLGTVCRSQGIAVEELLECEFALVNRLGWQVNKTKRTIEKWSRT